MPKQSAQVTLFARTNWEALTQEMAQGGGEHLASLATLLNVPADKLLAFFELAQDRYRALAEDGRLAPESAITGLRESMASHPMFAKVLFQTGE